MRGRYFFHIWRHSDVTYYNQRTYILWSTSSSSKHTFFSCWVHWRKTHTRLNVSALDKHALLLPYLSWAVRPFYCCNTFGKSYNPLPLSHGYVCTYLYVRETTRAYTVGKMTMIPPPWLLSFRMDLHVYVPRVNPIAISIIYINFLRDNICY